MGNKIIYIYLLTIAIITSVLHVSNNLKIIICVLYRFSEDKSYGREAYMAYIAEGLGDMLDWNVVMKFQRKNGSLFNSPSATAAALIYNYDDKALQYLNLLVGKFSGSGGTMYLPLC